MKKKIIVALLILCVATMGLVTLVACETDDSERNNSMVYVFDALANEVKSKEDISVRSVSLYSHNDFNYYEVEYDVKTDENWSYQNKIFVYDGDNLVNTFDVKSREKKPCLYVEYVSAKQNGERIELIKEDIDTLLKKAFDKKK